MDNNPVLLKPSVFGGYKKKDVLSYIFELNESTQEAQQKFAEQIEELSQSRDDLSQSAAEMESRLASMQASLNDAKKQLEAEKQKNAVATRQIEQLNNKIAEYEIEKNNASAHSDKTNSEFEEKKRQLEEEREQIELAASQIAGLLSKARDDADRVVAKAQKDADKITGGAKSKADGIIAAAKASADSHIKDSNQAFSDIYSKFGGFCEELGGLKKVVLDTTSELNAKIEELSKAAAETRDSVGEIPEVSDAVLEYTEEEYSDEKPSVAAVTAVTEEPSPLTTDILSRYGVRKDDSGFFRLAADR